jgi:uncharacterized integral membrane protein
MMGILGFLAALFLAVLFGYFAFLNQVPVQLNFPLLPPQRAFLHEVAGYSAIAGALVSAFLALGPLWKASRTVRALRRQVRALEEQMRPLRESAGTPALYSDNSTLLAPTRAATARADEEAV